MSIAFPDSPDDDGEKKKETRGGKREGSGRIADDVKQYRRLAHMCINYVERVAVAKGGDDWLMTKGEKDLLHEPLTEILTRWDITKLESPYIALPAAMYFYAYTEKRAKVADTKSWFAKRWDAYKISRKEKAAKKSADVE